MGDYTFGIHAADWFAIVAIYLYLAAYWRSQRRQTPATQRQYFTLGQRNSSAIITDARRNDHA